MSQARSKKKKKDIREEKGAEGREEEWGTGEHWRREKMRRGHTRMEDTTREEKRGDEVRGERSGADG